MIYLLQLFLLLAGGSRVISSPCNGEDGNDCYGEAWCIAQGDPHYVTYDGFLYDFQGHCTYLLTGDCVDHGFEVIVHHEPWFPGAAVRVCFQVDVVYGNQIVNITRSAITVNGNELEETTYDGHGVTIYEDGMFVAVELANGVTAYYDQMYYVKAKVTARWFGKLCGLCGNWNNDISDDVMNVNHDYSHSEYLRHDTRCTSGPEPTGCANDIVEQIAKQKCEVELQKIACPEVDINEKLGFCIYDECACGEPCLCGFLNDYMKDCYAKTNDQKYLITVCDDSQPPPPPQPPGTPTPPVPPTPPGTPPTPGTTPSPGPTTPQPPTSPQPPSPVDMSYDKSCTMTGDPHIQTFDDMFYTFNGNCWYIMTMDNCDKSWEVQVLMTPRSPGATETIVSEAKIRIDGIWIHFALNGYTPTANVRLSSSLTATTITPLGTSVYHNGGIEMYMNNDILHLSAKTKGIVAFWGLYYFKVGLKHWHASKTCGLCGSFDTNADNDIPLKIPAQAHLWKVEEVDCPDPFEIVPCVEEKLTQMEYRCMTLLKYLESKCPDVSGLYFWDFCITDMCSCGEACKCKLIISYFTECFIKTGDSTNLDFWRNKCSGGRVGVCSAWGDPHYTTFDGVQHHFQGMCEYIYTAVSGRFTVFTQNTAVRPGASVAAVSKVRVSFGQVEVTIDRQQVKINKQSVVLPATGDSYEVTESSGVVTVTTDIGLTVSYDMSHRIRVTVTEEYFNKTIGLCGVWNDSRVDENAMDEDHSIMQNFRFPNDICPDPVDPPSPPTCTGQDRVDHMNTCKNALKEHDCGLVDYMEDIEACILDMCTCGEYCLCDHVSAYVHKCYEETNDEAYSENPCTGDRPSPEAYCTASGDPHYRTFDGHRYDFQGVCWYIFAKDDHTNSWEIQTKNERKYDNAPVSYVYAVKVILSDTYLFTKDGSIEINSVIYDPQSPPTLSDECHLSISATKVIRMDCMDQFGFSVIYHRHSLRVNVDERWLSKTRGLCGLWNMGKADDKEFDNFEHAHRMAVANQDPPCPTPSDPQCSEEDYKKSEAKCELLDKLSSVCPESVIARAKPDCAYDVCICGDRCLCDAVADAAAACAFALNNDTILDIWTDLVKMCIETGDKGTATCLAIGDPHYIMFDGTTHHFQGVCEYILAATDKWRVITDNDPVFPGSPVSSVKKVTIILEDDVIVITETQVTVIDDPVMLPYDTDNFCIVIEGTCIVVYTNMGLKVVYGGSLVKVVVDERWKGKTSSGLCGTYNGDSSDDVTFIEDHSRMQSFTAYGVCAEQPQTPGFCSSHQDREKAEDLCRAKLEELQCNEVEYSDILEFCIMDVCECGEMCFCPVMQGYRCLCYDATKDQQYATDICAPESEGTMQLCEAMGDPHYTTFDGYKYDFQGMCEYVFAADDNGTWTVVTDNVPWKPGAIVSRVGKVTVYIQNLEIEISQDVVKINGEDQDSFPVHGTGDFYEVENTNGFITVRTKIGLIVKYDQWSFIEVFIGERWYNRTWGLCGIWNSDKSDEESMDADHEQIQIDTLYGKETCDDPPPPPPQCGSECNRDMAESMCKEAFEDENCGIPYDDRMDQCIQDMCACGPPCLCSHIHSYLQACYRRNNDEQFNRNPCENEDLTNVGTCFAYGEPHFKTFDGTWYEFQGKCTYTLARDCVGNTWKVEIKTDSPTLGDAGGTSTIVNVIITIIASDGINFVIEMARDSSDVKIDNVRAASDYTNPLFTISYGLGSRTIAANDFSVVIHGGFVKVIASESMIGKTCGLCGNYNLGISDEYQYLDPVYANTFAAEGKDCDVPAVTRCTDEEIVEATIRCQAMKGLSHLCPAYVIDHFMKDCIYDVCHCKDACLCDAIENAAIACADCTGNTGLLRDWRKLVPICIERAAECSAWGDPHYITFDSVLHNFQGMCEYVFAADYEHRLWKVITRNEPISEGSSYSSVAEVTIKFNSRTIVISRDDIIIDGSRLTEPPVLNSEYTILKHGAIVEVSTVQGVKVLYDMEHHVKVVVDERWANRVCGLCGNFDGNTDDELAMSRNHTDMQEKHLYSSSCEDPPPPPECTSEEEQQARDRCQSKYAQIQCDEVDPATAIDFCIQDECGCGDDCFCPNLKAYYQECYDVTRDPFYLEDPTC